MTENPTGLAKATEEVAKTAGKAVDAAREFGGYLAPLVRQPLEHIMGIWEDKLRYSRWERQIRLINRAKEFLAEDPLHNTTRTVPLKFLAPLLEAGSLEDDDQLQDIYARLLANVADVNQDVKPLKAYISVVQEFTSIEAHILEFMRLMSNYKGEFLSYYILDFVHWFKNRNLMPSPDITEELFQIPVWNLYRLGCIIPNKDFVATQTNLTAFYMTPFGLAVANACASKKLRSEG